MVMHSSARAAAAGHGARPVALMMTLMMASLACVLAPAAHAKLPPLSDEAKAKASEAAARTAWGDKVAAYQLCRAQDRVAAAYRANPPAGKTLLPPVEAPACTDPGAFVYEPTPPKPPIEAAGAHSPAQTAASPPSTTTPAAQLPAKK